MVKPSKESKLKALEALMSQTEKKYGKNSLARLGDLPETVVDTFSTGSLRIDIATGVGGLPRGRVIEIYGPESSGKTSLSLHAIASAQKAGGIAAFVDAEHALDPEYAKNLGVNIDDLLFSQPSSGEEALQLVEMLANSNAVDLIVVDSVAALTPEAEIKGEIGDSHVGLQARLMSQALRKITSAVSNTKTTVIFINQLREKVGVFFGSPETTSGGKALKFYASMRIDIRRTGSEKLGEDTVANNIKVKIVKNKVAPPFKIAQTKIFFGTGFSKEDEVLDEAIERGIVKKSGSWISYEGQQVAQGLVKAKEALENNPELFQEIEGKVLAQIDEQKEELRRKGQERRERMAAGSAKLAESSATLEDVENEED